MKIFSFFAFLILSSTVYAQTNAVGMVKDTTYLYTDTVNKKAYLGDYEPTGLIKAMDGGCIISTTFSIYFRELYDGTYPASDIKKYIEISKLYESHQNTSSGSIFKLNKQYKKEWEIFFKEKRVKQITRCDDTSFIAAGERTDQKNIWVARINSASGKVIWFKEFSNKRNPGLEGLSISVDKQIIVLSESKRIVPISIRKQYGRIRSVFFKEPENGASKDAILSIANDGQLNWRKGLRIRKRYDLFDQAVAADSVISIVSDYSTTAKRDGKDRNVFGDFNYLFDLTGHRLAQDTFHSQGRYLTNINGWIFSHTSGYIVHLYKYDDRMNETFTTAIKTQKHFTSLQTMSLIDNCYYLLGNTGVKEVMICKLDGLFNLLSSMVYQTKEMITDCKLAKSPNGNIMVIGKVYKRENDNENAYQYINLLEFNFK